MFYRHVWWGKTISFGCLGKRSQGRPFIRTEQPHSRLKGKSTFVCWLIDSATLCIFSFIDSQLKSPPQQKRGSHTRNFIEKIFAYFHCHFRNLLINLIKLSSRPCSVHWLTRGDASLPTAPSFAYETCGVRGHLADNESENSLIIRFKVKINR
jgi:hypothetical protein